MAIKIISKRNGFRRCGVAHPETPTTYPAGRFSKEELAMLQAEPMLVVLDAADAEVDGVDAMDGFLAKVGKPLKKLDVPELVELCELIGIDVPVGAKKADLVALVEEYAPIVEAPEE